jgi:hypothetical protein
MSFNGLVNYITRGNHTISKEISSLFLVGYVKKSESDRFPTVGVVVVHFLFDYLGGYKSMSRREATRKMNLSLHKMFGLLVIPINGIRMIRP